MDVPGKGSCHKVVRWFSSEEKVLLGEEDWGIDYLAGLKRYRAASLFVSP